MIVSLAQGRSCARCRFFPFFMQKWVMDALATDAPQELPACHVFTVDGEFYAYDLNTQQLVAVAAPLADLLRAVGEADSTAQAALRKAQDHDGLFLPLVTRLVPGKVSSAEVDQGLRHLILTVTESCNMRCAYCLHGADLKWVRSHGTGRMSVATALAATTYFLDRSDSAHKPVISFYGGEALLNPEVITAVVTATRNRPDGDQVKFIIDTNGLLLSGSLLDFVLRECVYLQVSIDGPAVCHDRYRVDSVGKPTLARILTNIGRLLDRDPDLVERLSYVVTLAPPIDLFAVAEMFASFSPYVTRGILKPPLLTVNFANLEGQHWPSRQEETAGLPPLATQLAQAEELYLQAFADQTLPALSPVLRALFEPDLIRFHHRSRSPLAATYTPGANCRPGIRKLHVDIDGRLFPCERTGKVFALGELGEQGLKEDRVQELHETFHEAVRDRCGSCWALRQCGVCFATQAGHADPTVDAFPVPESVCAAVRQRRERTMALMVRILALAPATRSWLDETKLA